MRDWSSDVCSSDLIPGWLGGRRPTAVVERGQHVLRVAPAHLDMMGPGPGLDVEIIFALIGEDRDLMVETRAPRHEGDAFGPPLARAIGVGRMRDRKSVV